MKAFSLVVLGIVLALSRPASAEEKAKVDAKAFLESVQGAYQIDSAGGHVPAPENNQAEVFADVDEGILTMPFCGTNGLCDPGYVDLSYSRTTADRVDFGPDHYVVEFNTSFGAKKYRYTWENESGRVTFTNYQYLLGTQVTQLQHILHKVAN